jgi:hypothetical protein
MPNQPQPIGRVLGRTSSVGLLLVSFGCVIAVIGMADRPLALAPVLSMEAPALTEPSPRSLAGTHLAGTWTAPSQRGFAVGMRDHGPPQDGFATQRAATTPLVLDRRHDRRADLMDMAISIRSHRSAASELPPGAN